ncbi:hypothetical protein AALP_AA6G359400 [Arabis alpina]|uniref:F-box domain-containing protein n=1 Tax=Arabis alpina TaxID=50452 RepID=A0A087GTW5_ARAAL|nr:hypothetical protein AALP_AA6G359400 [Arabis alpina]
MCLSSSPRKRGIKKRNPIPIDLVMEEILARLPAKSLMRFKCVSKLWSSHIMSRHFNNLFLTVPSRPRPRLYMTLGDHKAQESVILSLAPDTTTLSTFVVDHGLTIPEQGGYILQNLNGFMCHTYGKQPRIFNPATRQLVTLTPPVEVEEEEEEDWTRDFSVRYYCGHDPINDQYKVICSTSVFFKFWGVLRSELWVFVLNCRGSSWKKVPDFFPHHLPSLQGLCIDGVIYYLALIATHDYIIVTFHIASEEFKSIQVPHKEGELLPRTLTNRNHNLIDYGGKLTIVDQTKLGDEGMLDLWVLEDATNKEWSRKTLVLQPSQLHLVNSLSFKVKCTTQNGKLFLIPPEGFLPPFHVLCYDMQSNDMSKIEIKGVPNWSSEDKVDFDFMFMDQSESLIHLET